MTTTLENSGSGFGGGGPGMWDPMPLVPPVRPPSEPKQDELIWSRPEPAAPAAEEASKPAAKKPAAKKPAPKKTAAKKPAAKKPAAKKTAKKASPKKKK